MTGTLLESCLLPDHRLEVKSRQEAWTRPADFRYRTMFVDTFSGFLLKLKRPIAYVCVSQLTDAVAVIPTFTCNHWTLERKKERQRKTNEGKPFEDETHRQETNDAPLGHRRGDDFRTTLHLLEHAGPAGESQKSRSDEARSGGLLAQKFES